MVANEAKVSLTLSGEALAVLEKQASPRKRGEFVSSLLIQYGAVDSGGDAVDIEGMKLMIMGLAGANKTLEGRVVKLERQVAAMMRGGDAPRCRSFEIISLLCFAPFTSL